MAYFISGVVLIVASASGLWASLPRPDGTTKAFIEHGVGAWIAVGVTVTGALGLGALIVGAIEVFGPLS